MQPRKKDRDGSFGDNMGKKGQEGDWEGRGRVYKE